MANSKHLMTAPRETVSFVSLRPLIFPLIGVEGKQNSLVPVGPFIKCFVILPNSKIEKKNCKETVC